MRGKYILTGVLVLFLSCKLFGPEEKPKVDREASKAKSEEAGRVLEESLGKVKPEAPPQDALGEMDLDYIRDLYDEALRLDPSNSAAHFGMAITELLMVLRNERVQEVLDSLCSFLEGSSIVEGIARSPMEVYGMAKRAWPPGAAKPAMFRVSEVQEIVEQEVLPRLGRALGHLEEVEKDEEFRVYIHTETLKPVMEALAGGMEEEFMPPPKVDSLEVDLGEVYVLDAQVRLLRAWLLMLTAYNLDFDYEGSYEFLRAESDSVKLAHLYRLDRSSSFLTLRSGDNPSRAKRDILDALDKLEEAVDFIRAEDDPQEDDIIKEQDLDQEIWPEEDAPEFLGDVETVEDLIAKARQLLSGPITVEDDFNGDGRKEELQVNLSAWLDNPPRDLKALLPYHRWYPENFGNDNFYDDLVLTDAQGNPLGEDDPPFVLPDPSFGGIFPQFVSNEEFLAFFGLPLTGGPLFPVDPLRRSGEELPLLSSAGGR